MLIYQSRQRYADLNAHLSIKYCTLHRQNAHHYSFPRPSAQSYNGNSCERSDSDDTPPPHFLCPFKTQKILSKWEKYSIEMYSIHNLEKGQAKYYELWKVNPKIMKLFNRRRKLISMPNTMSLFAKKGGCPLWPCIVSS